jgi:GntR family transcriptional regulator/MocR family aminotransferase
LRIGYLVVPEALIGAAREAKALLNNGNAWLEQAVLAEFIASGQFATHLRRIRRSYLGRRDCLIEALARHFGGAEVTGGDGGMHLGWRLPDAFPTALAVQRASQARGVAVYSVEDGPAVALRPTGAFGRLLLFGYPCLDEIEIAEAAGRLANALNL